MKNTHKPGTQQNSKSLLYNPLRGITTSSLSMDDKKHRQLIKKIGQSFISYKNQNSNQKEINIAGYKTTGSTKITKIGINGNIKSLGVSMIQEQQYWITKESIEKYLFTFCFEIGCELPSQEELKLIYSMLLAHSKGLHKTAQQLFDESDDQQSNLKLIQNGVKSYKEKRKAQNHDSIKKLSLYLLIKLCLDLYIQSKKTNIGGIVERLIIQIRKEIELEDADKENKQDQQQQNQNQKN